MKLPINFNQFSEKQKVVLLVCVATIFLGIGIGLVTARKTPPPPSPAVRLPEPIAVPTPIPASFRLEPSAKTLKVGETLSLSLSLTTGNFPADAVDAILTYDPTLFKAEKILPGKIFSQYLIKQIDNKKGRVQLSAAAELKEGKITSFSGQGEYGAITFRALKATPLSGAQILLDPNSVVASAGKNILELEESAEGIYTIIPK